MWGQIAQDLLDAADDSLTGDRAVERRTVQPGPDFRRDCRMLAVYLAGTRQVNQPNGATIPGACATMTQGDYRVSFTAACVPASAQPPAEADVSAFGGDFLDDVRTVHVALLNACGPIGRRCSSVAVGDGEPSGPSGGFVTWVFPVTVVGI